MPSSKKTSKDVEEISKASDSCPMSEAYKTDQPSQPKQIDKSHRSMGATQAPAATEFTPLKLKPNKRSFSVRLSTTHHQKIIHSESEKKNHGSSVVD